LSFKIFLIQKSQISIFRKALNLFEFENVFDLDLNLGFKFKSAAKIFQKHFSFSLGSPKSFSAHNSLQPTHFIFIFLDFIHRWPNFVFGPAPSPLGFWPDFGPLFYRLPPSVIKPPPPPIPSVATVPPVPCTSGRWIASLTRPLPAPPLHFPSPSVRNQI
jgi:hypothetical protein